MIRVLVVDDDKLTRNGLISCLPWGDFGMEVVGEANNGERAHRQLELDVARDHQRAEALGQSAS
jgi:two-component system response regulator YesN